MENLNQGADMTDNSFRCFSSSGIFEKKKLSFANKLSGKVAQKTRYITYSVGGHLLKKNQGHARSVPGRLISMCGFPYSSILCHSTFLVRTISKKGIVPLKSLRCHASKENVSTTHHSSSIWVVDLEQSQQQQQQKIRRRERRPCHVRNAFTVTRREVLLQEFHVLRGRVQSNNWFSFYNTSPQWNYFLLYHRSLRGQQEIIE